MTGFGEQTPGRRFKVGDALGMSAADVKWRHDKEVIQRRNDIAHRADLDPQGNRRPMTADEAGTAVEWVFNGGVGL